VAVGHPAAAMAACPAALFLPGDFSQVVGGGPDMF
jgi:hypothetical protein